MTNYYYKTPTKTHKDPTRFSGIIYQSDFEIDYRGKANFSIAERIASDWRFDERCRKNIEARNKQKARKEVQYAI